MVYKLKTVNAETAFFIQANGVIARSTMATSAAREIIRNGKFRPSKLPNYPICIDEKFWFEGEHLQRINRVEQ